MGSLLTLLGGYRVPPGGYHWDTTPENWLLYPEAFDNAAWSKTQSYIAANCLAGPDGAVTAEKLVEDGTVGSYHTLWQNPVFTGTGTLSARVKRGGRDWVKVYLDNFNNKGVSFNLATGAKGTENAGYTGTITPAGSDFYDVSVTGTIGTGATKCGIRPTTGNDVDVYSGLGHQGTAAAGGSTTTAVLAAGASASNDTYNNTEIIFSDAPTTIHTVTGYVGATKTATFTPARASAPDGTTYTVGPGIYIARAQLTPGSVARPFYNGGDLQNAITRWGTPPALYRGSTTGADANDLALAATGWQGTGTHYGLTGNLSGVSMAGDWTALVVVACPGTTGTLMSLANGASDTAFNRFVYNASGQLKIGTKNGVTENWSGNLAVPTSGALPLAWQSKGGTLYLTRLDTGAVVSVTNDNPTGTPRIGLGVLARASIAAVADAATFSFQSFYPGRALSLGEQLLWRRTVKRILAAKASPITVP